MQCLILAGGLGTRMRPITETIPKAMIEAAGKPFVDHQLALLARQGVREAVFGIGYLGDRLRDYVGNGRRWGISASFVDEGGTLRGTAGAVRLALDRGQLGAGFLVMYGDSYLPAPLAPLWAASGYGTIPTLAVLRNQGMWDRSNVRLEGEAAYYDKRVADPAGQGMQHIDYGVSVMSRDDILRAVPPDAVVDLADVYHAMSSRGELRAFEVRERFYEVGSSEGLRDFEAYLRAAGDNLR